MKSITQLRDFARNKDNFHSINNYLTFCKHFIEFIDNSQNYQAKIIARNESNYQFIQYDEQVSFQITRPINSKLFLTSNNIESSLSLYANVLKEKELLINLSTPERKILNNSIYTIQQSIGCALDALPASENNTGKKVNGDLFEQLILLTFKEMQFDCNRLVESLPIIDEGVEIGKSIYQHDLVFRKENDIQVIGSVKTSSKDRIDKVFLNKIQYNRLKGKDVSHIAIFLNDVQRKENPPKIKVGGTFLPGHFKEYTVTLSPLDGVYYCDLRPLMIEDPYLNKRIKSIDYLLCKDIWELTK